MTRYSRCNLACGAALAVSVLVLAAGRPAPALSAASIDAEEQARAFPPVESDLASKAWVSVTATSSDETASRAVDDDPRTAWLPSRKGRQALTLDLGGAYDNIRKVGVLFPDPRATYRYVIEASSDGKRWRPLVDRSHNRTAGRGEEHLITRPDTSHLRITITGATRGATIGLSEISAFNYLRDDLALGADISYADQNNTQGLTYFVNDPEQAAPVLETVSDAGMEYTRLRVFNDPRNEQSGEFLEPAHQGPERTRDVAGQVVGNGMGLGIDFHYSDSWADPSKQAKPTSWRELPFNELTQAVYNYTYQNVDALIEQGSVPDKVAVGNELINGFMWGSERPQPWFDESAWCGVCYFNADPSFVSQPGGALLWDYWGSDDPAERAAYDAAWDRFATLQAAGIKAVRDVSASHGEDIDVETHVIIDNGRVDKTLEFWDQFLTRLKAKGQDIDVIAHSYYPDWHGTPQHYEANLHAVAAAHPRYALEIAETSHQSNDYDGIPVPNSPFPKTAQGAGQFLQEVFRIANDLPDNRGAGVLVWEPANWQEMIDWNNSVWPRIKFHDTIKVYEDSDAEYVLEDTIHRTVGHKRALVLPATVRLLTTASRSTRAIRVAWEAHPSRPSPGQLVVHGTTEHGAVTAVVDVVRRHR